MKDLSWHYYVFYRGQTVASVPVWVEAQRVKQMPKPLRLRSSPEDEETTLAIIEQEELDKQA